MIDLFHTEPQVHCVRSFDELISTSFSGEKNAMCWPRTLTGDFSEIIKKVRLSENMATIEPEDLNKLELSEQGQLARDTILNDLKLLTDYGAAPVLNVIRYYERDTTNPFFPTDVYSFHADRSPIATDTFLCTYYGAPSEILPNSQGIRKVLIPEIRHELKKLYRGPDAGFDSFLSEHCYDLHYQANLNARAISLGRGHLWKLAVDCPNNQVAPCIHRAPEEKPGEDRLLLIC